MVAFIPLLLILSTETRLLAELSELVRALRCLSVWIRMCPRYEVAWFFWVILEIVWMSPTGPSSSK